MASCATVRGVMQDRAIMRSTFKQRAGIQEIIMPLHDWSQVDGGTFHDFHNSWLVHLKEVLNGGLLPQGYYALSEQHSGRFIADILTLHVGPSLEGASVPMGGLAVAEAPPQAERQLTVSPAARSRRRTLTIRHVTGHRIVAF